MSLERDLPHAVRVIEHVLIPLADGIRLAAKIWLPETADDNPVPAILEYIPYRKRDSSRMRDQRRHAYLAGHGYACVRVDLRGTGDSDGVYHDEYLPQEQQDGVAVIDWIARQPWCAGQVGMIGISWGGFNGLQIAALRPPALKAVVSVGSTDDRYATDVHYLGGCLTKDNLDWSAVMFSHNALPPDPELVGESWRDKWLARLDANCPWAIQWLEHQRRDAYWRQGSVAEDFAAIEVPVYAINGWADNYAEAVPRLLAGLSGPRKGLVGPWAHAYPHNGMPGPAIGFLQEVVRWFDHWLKGIDTGIMHEPMYRVWMQESVPPRTSYTERPGRWVAEPCWPSERIAWRRLVMNPGGLDQAAGPEMPLVLSSLQTTGVSQGELGRYGEGGEFPEDQRIDDGSSLVFLTEPLAERVEILGAPIVELDIASDRPVALVAVRLNDVAPDGASTRVQHGVLNLCQRDDREHAAKLVPGERYKVRVEIDDIAHAFPPGHRIAISVSSCYWPMVWPSPEPVTLTVHAGSSQLQLPVRRPDPADDALRPFGPPAQATPAPVTELRSGASNNRTITRDAKSGATVVHQPRDYGVDRLDDIDLEMEEAGDIWHKIVEGDPLAAESWTSFVCRRRRGDWNVEVRTRQRLTCDRTDFFLEADIEAFDDGRRIFSRSWNLRFPRDHI